MFSIDKMPGELMKYCEVYVFFDFYRLVNPETYETYEYSGGKLIPQNEPCYKVWCREAMCSNCSSRRAVAEKHEIVKLEYSENCVMLIYSVPAVVNDEEYSLELIKNVTDSFMIKLPLYNENETLSDFIDSINAIITHDTFTGLYNKYYIYKELSRCMAAAVKNNRALSAAFIDIDDFKAVNDTYGHVKGDEVIKELAACIKDVTAEGKIYGARIGGDEFMIVFSETDFKKSQKLCKELAEKISKHEFDGGGNRKFNVEISYGLQEFDKASDRDEFINRIDTKMYDMKRSKPAKV